MQSPPSRTNMSVREGGLRNPSRDFQSQAHLAQTKLSRSHLPACVPGACHCRT